MDKKATYYYFSWGVVVSRKIQTASIRTYICMYISSRVLHHLTYMILVTYVAVSLTKGNGDWTFLCRVKKKKKKGPVGFKRNVGEV